MSESHVPRILIIDNDEGLAQALAIRLESLGYVCAGACNGAQGVSVFGEGDFDLVLTDLNMPGGDGISVVKSLRRHSRVPIIVMTGFTDAYRDELRKLARVSCVRKPIETEALVELIETELALAPADATT